MTRKIINLDLALKCTVSSKVLNCKNTYSSLQSSFSKVHSDNNYSLYFI